MNSIRIVCISDTHYTDHLLDALEVPQGDVLIHAGDATFNGKIGEIGKFMQWMNRQPHRVKLFVPGNHDFWFEHSVFPSDTVRTVLNEWYSFKLDGHIWTVFGMSWVINLPSWAFFSHEGLIARFLKRSIGADDPLDILITHSPPFGRLDFYRDLHRNADGVIIEAGSGLGSKALRAFVDSKKPPLHVFGHIHEQHGFLQEAGTTYINAAMLGDDYQPKFDPIVVDLFEDGTVVPVLA